MCMYVSMYVCECMHACKSVCTHAVTQKCIQNLLEDGLDHATLKEISNKTKSVPFHRQHTKSLLAHFC
jgi:hypothetical protein